MYVCNKWILRYDTALGLTQDDSGFGPPSGSQVQGWIRTGHASYGGDEFSHFAGQVNCLTWTSDSGWGTVLVV